MPAAFASWPRAAASAAGFAGFAPDACLINRYEPGTRLSLHQDRDERDYDRPIVSVSLGMPAVFLFGGLEAIGPGGAAAARAWRRGCLGRTVAAALPRRAAAEGGLASADRRAAHQPDVSQGALTVPGRAATRRQIQGPAPREPTLMRRPCLEPQKTRCY